MTTTANTPESDLEALKAQWQAVQDAQQEAKKARQVEAYKVLLQCTEKYGKREEKWDVCITGDHFFVVATNETSDVQWQKYKAEIKKDPEAETIALQALVSHHIVHPSKEVFNKACQSAPALAERIGKLYLLPLLQGFSELKMGEL